jgi:hypothetical protein
VHTVAAVTPATLDDVARQLDRIAATLEEYQTIIMTRRSGGGDVQPRRVGVSVVWVEAEQWAHPTFGTWGKRYRSTAFYTV